MLLPDEMADIGLIVDIQLLAVLAVLSVALINRLSIVPARDFPL